MENRWFTQRQHVNSKFEIRSTKQIQIFKEQKILNGPVWGFEFWFVSDFDIRILLRWMLGAINFRE